mmetsp:Transcript_21808/g.19341  ORF Transcript_21808/g.19341 Transcript_21808/m.19341 type:complete len:237 (+) Transcript_21808:218-928(+)
MHDRQGSLKFYKLAFDLSKKELGFNSYLTKTLSERIEKVQSDGVASTNPSEKDVYPKQIKSRRRRTNSRKRQLYLNKKLDNTIRHLTKFPLNKDDDQRSASQLSNKCDSYRTDMAKFLRNSKNYSNISITNSDENRVLRNKKKKKYASRVNLNKSALSVKSTSNQSITIESQFRIRRSQKVAHKSKRRRMIVTNPYASLISGSNYSKVNKSFYKDSVSPITKKYYPEIVLKGKKQK